MNYLPVFADLRQRPVLVVGGGEVAMRKITLLLRAGAEVRVAARELCSLLDALQQDGKVTWIAREFSPELLDPVFLVIAATDDAKLNETVSKAADRRQKLVNVVDDQPKCSFIFPSLIDRSPLMVAISSSGAAPVLARLLREKLEALLPSRLGQ
ncbi:precorrin-2 dehydrogenase/sirohydrochlorin ferrochelatase family protein, partial [Lonsdalea populi]